MGSTASDTYRYAGSPDQLTWFEMGHYSYPVPDLTSAMSV